jgi:DNA repair protein RadC
MRAVRWPHQPIAFPKSPNADVTGRGETGRERERTKNPDARRSQKRACSQAGVFEINNGGNTMKKTARNEDSPAYMAAATTADDETIRLAKNILLMRLRKPGDYLNSPASVRDFLTLTLGNVDHEIFAVTYLDAQHRVIDHEELFRGTLTQTSVYPREVVKRALFFNAAALIFAHNHPSGATEPSQSDRMLTDALKQALALVDVRVLDHFIVAGSDTLSFAERGMI